MKKQILLLATLSLLFMVSVAGAGEEFPPALKSGYAITTNWHGEYVPLGSSVNATAYTTNPDVIKVEFIWKDPNETIIWDVNVTVAEDGWYNSKKVYWANNTQTILGPLGDWGVQALFYDEYGHIRGQDSQILAIRATSFEAVPEVPLGTIATILTFFGALAVYATLRKREDLSGAGISK